MKLITAVFHDTALLPHFLRHYSALGVSEFMIGLYMSAANRRAVEEHCRGYKYHLIPIRGRFDARKDNRMRQSVCRRFVGPNEWWVVADLDEFHEYPKPLGRLVAELECGGYSYLQSHLLDRITADGTSPWVRPDVSLWDQFPAAADVTRRLMRAGGEKILLVRGHARTVAGHHRPAGKLAGRVRAGGLVHHFKWHGDIGTKIGTRRASIFERGRKHYPNLDRFLRFWDEHHRLPVMGEFNFHFPKKPRNWPEWESIGTCERRKCPPVVNAAPGGYVRFEGSESAVLNNRFRNHHIREA